MLIDTFVQDIEINNIAEFWIDAPKEFRIGMVEIASLKELKSLQY